jgi:hypothetical protein
MDLPPGQMSKEQRQRFADWEKKRQVGCGLPGGRSFARHGWATGAHRHVRHSLTRLCDSSAVARCASQDMVEELEKQRRLLEAERRGLEVRGGAS